VITKLHVHLEIVSSILKVTNDDKVVRWTDLIYDLEDFITEHYDGKNMSVFRGDWKRRIKAVAKTMACTLSGNDDFQEAWENWKVTFKAGKVQKASTRTSESNYRLSEEEKLLILQQYNSILDEHRWTLSTGTVVSDQMKQLVTDSLYEHPVHSMIIDPDDTVWKNYFSPAELKEIRTQGLKPLGQLPQDLTECIDLYDQEWSTAIDLYHPVNEFDKKWLREVRCGRPSSFSTMTLWT
jgi:hypothetical protein